MTTNDQETKHTDFLEDVKMECDRFNRGEAFEVSTAEQFQELIARMDFDAFIVIGLADELDD